MSKTLTTAGSSALASAASAFNASDGVVLEIAYFELHPGTAEQRILAAAQHVQDRFLPRFDGRIYRELMREDGGDYWIDSIHWETLGQFSKAASEILSDPDGAPLLELIDPSSLAWFHAHRVTHWPAGDFPRGPGFTEIRLFRGVGAGGEIELLTPTTDADLLAAARAVQPAVARQPGFVDRELFRTEDGWWLDLVHWASKEVADASAQAMMAELTVANSSLIDYSKCVDPKSLKTFRMQQMRVW